MKTISNLANDQPPAKRRKKGNEGRYKDVRTGSISADFQMSYWHNASRG
jgi:hypothetical protein